MLAEVATGKRLARGMGDKPIANCVFAQLGMPTEHSMPGCTKLPAWGPWVSGGQSRRSVLPPAWPAAAHVLFDQTTLYNARVRLTAQEALASPFLN